MDSTSAQPKLHRGLALAFGLLLLAAGYALWPEKTTSRDSVLGVSDSAGRATGSGNEATAAQLAGRLSSDPSSKSTIQSEAEANLPYSRTRHYPSALVVAGMEENESRVEAIEALMETWVAANPRQAADWAGSLPAGAFRDDALSALMVHWGGQSPADAAAWMSRTGVDDGEAASVLAGIWAAKDPSNAASWAGTMENLESRRLATTSVASAWADTAPQAAAAYAAKLSPGDRAPAITAVLATWATTAPSQAAAWVANIKFDTPEEQGTALATLVTPWSRQSPAAASRFINTLPEGPAREAAASQFAVSAAATAPAEALTWGMNLTDPEHRNQVVADACESWYDGDPETFRAGIAEAISLMDDPAMRRGVYEMLYERDPAFQTSLLKLVDSAPLPATEAPAASDPAPAAPAPEPAPEPSAEPAPVSPAPDEADPADDASPPPEFP